MAPTVKAAVRDATATLARAGVDEPGLEAGILLARLLGKSRAWLFAHPEAVLPAPVHAHLVSLVEQRRRGVPIAHLTGEREFWSLPLLVTPDTLIPRPETELLVERALALVTAGKARVADLGTGSGAIAAALAHERPEWRILATDRSEAALAVARQNFSRLRLQVETRPGDWTAALDDERFELIVSNPPYIPRADPHLETGDLRNEPRSALAAGDDGLDALRRLAAETPQHLLPGAWLAVEHGWNQGADVRQLLHAAGFEFVRTHRDLAGHERVTEGRRPG